MAGILDSMFRRQQMGADDPGGPIDLAHVESPGTVAGNPAQYRALMQYMTQPAAQMGPAGRRAEALMPAGPRDVHDDVTMQQDPGVIGMLMRMFGGGR